MARVVYAKRIFACAHEFVPMPMQGRQEHFVCARCEHIRMVLPYDTDTHHSLLVFPVPLAGHAKSTSVAALG